MNFVPQIEPISRLQRDHNSVFEQLQNGPVFLTHHGNATAVMVSTEAWDTIATRLAFFERIHGIRACAICPGEVDTPILERRPVPVTAEERATMVKAEDCGEIIAFIARLPAHVCINELTVSPTWNRGFVAGAKALQDL